MLREFQRGLLFTLVTMLLFGGAYHGLIWGVGRLVFPAQAEGSLIRNADGAIAGSSLVAQKATRPEYFQPRPSAVDYDAASTGGSNSGPSNLEHLAAVKGRIDAIVARDKVPAADIPSEMVTAGGGGLDPHIPPAGAEIQVARVAEARNVDPGKVRELVVAYTQPPTFGVFGRARVNVLELNLALDRQLGRAHD